MQGCGTNPTCHLFRTYRQTDIGHRSQLIHLFNLNKKKSVFRPVSYFCIMMKHLGRIALTIQVVLMILMATATAMGKIHGTAFAKEHIFSSLAFVLLWIALAISSLSYLIIRKVNKRPAAFMLHLSFIVITIGALTTWSTGQYGKMQLTKEKNVSSFFENGTIENIPFSITLKNFKIQYYTGTNSPMDFICRIQIDDGQKTTEEQASMNHVIRHKGYRFGMSGYDENGTVTLSVTHDPFGIAITYAGFAVMLLAMALFFFDKCVHRPLLLSLLRMLCRRFLHTEAHPMGSFLNFEPRTRSAHRMSTPRNPAMPPIPDARLDSTPKPVRILYVVRLEKKLIRRAIVYADAVCGRSLESRARTIPPMSASAVVVMMS